MPSYQPTIGRDGGIFLCLPKPHNKYYNGAQEPGLSGRSSPLESSNPFVTWMGVSYNTVVKKFIMAVAYHAGEDKYDSSLYMISSEDGITWSPRVALIQHCNCELIYPTIINPKRPPQRR
jgi:hypothetical protein